MALKLSISERTLIRKFKKTTGNLPNHYLQKIRVQKAKQLLISTNDSFEHITYLVGYTNTSTFRSLFKNMTGLNPGIYRKYFMVKSNSRIIILTEFFIEILKYDNVRFF